MPKTKVMVVSAVPAPVVTFTCNGHPVEQVATFKYLGLQSHQSGSIAHIVTPIRSKDGASWAAVQRRQSLLQCGNTISLHLHLLQAILVPVLQYGCQIWGMHSPRVAAANDARAALQRLNDYYLRTICRLAPSTPRKLLLTELGLLPLQVFWWRQTLQFWNGLAGPIGSLYHTVCLGNLTDAFQEGTCNLANSLAACLHSVGFEMPRVHDVMPLLDVDGVVEALTARLQSTGSGSLYCPRAAPLRVLFHAHTSSGLSLIAHVGGIVSFLFLGGTCSEFCSLGWAVMACQLLLAVWLVLAGLFGLQQWWSWR